MSGLGTLGWGDPGSGYGTRYVEVSILIITAFMAMHFARACNRTNSMQRCLMEEVCGTSVPEFTTCRCILCFDVVFASDDTRCARCRSQEDLFSTFETGVAAGCNLFDTAEVCPPHILHQRIEERRLDQVGLQLCPLNRDRICFFAKDLHCTCAAAGVRVPGAQEW